MKRLLLFILALALLCGCAAAPVLREGYYLVPLEESGGAPMYYCLESGGTGYVHAMGVDVQITWTPQGLGGEHSDGVPTEDGLEFPSEDSTILCTYSETLPESYTQPILLPGFYTPTEEDYASLLLYAELRSDGTGVFSIMGQSQPIEWTPTGFYLGDTIATATAGGFVAQAYSVPINFAYTGDSLPEGYLPDPPPPGTYSISSTSYNGNMQIYGAPDPQENGLVLQDDGTGCLTFGGEEYPLTWDGSVLILEGGYALMLMYMPDQGQDPPLLMAYTLDADCPIEADSIALRLVEGE